MVSRSHICNNKNTHRRDYWNLIWNTNHARNLHQICLLVQENWKYVLKSGRVETSLPPMLLPRLICLLSFGDKWKVCLARNWCKQKAFINGNLKSWGRNCQKCLKLLFLLTNQSKWDQRQTGRVTFHQRPVCYILKQGGLLDQRQQDLLIEILYAIHKYINNESYVNVYY